MAGKSFLWRSTSRAWSVRIHLHLMHVGLQAAPHPWRYRVRLSLPDSLYRVSDCCPSTVQSLRSITSNLCANGGAPLDKCTRPYTTIIGRPTCTLEIHSCTSISSQAESCRVRFDCSPVQTDSRNRLSKFWTPTGGISQQDGDQGPQATVMPIAQLTAESRRFTCPSPPWRLSSPGTTFHSSVTTPVSSRVGSLWSIPSPTARPARAKQA
jgi:hypothetical protein